MSPSLLPTPIDSDDLPSTFGQALVVRGPGDVGLEPRAALPPSGTQVRVTPHYVGMCGTDLEILNGDMDPDYVRYPVVLGHEWSGVVAEVGEHVRTVNVGDSVVVEGIRPCSTCPACRRGATNLCEVYDELGFTRDGAAGPSVTTEQHLVHRLEADVPLETGALVEPGSVVLRGLSEIQLLPGMRVLVVGDGTVGLLAAHLVQLWSPSYVSVAGQREAQRSLAQAMGVDEFTIETPAERSFDVVIEAAGSIAAVDVALRAARRGGQVLLLGIAGHGKTAQVGTDDFVNNDLRIRGSFGYTAASWAQTTALLNAGRFAPAPLITHRFPLSGYADALAALARPSDGPRGKVLLDLTASA